MKDDAALAHLCVCFTEVSRSSQQRLFFSLFSRLMLLKGQQCAWNGQHPTTPLHDSRKRKVPMRKTGICPEVSILLLCCPLVELGGSHVWKQTGSEDGHEWQCEDVLMAGDHLATQAWRTDCHALCFYTLEPFHTCGSVSLLVRACVRERSVRHAPLALCVSVTLAEYLARASRRHIPPFDFRSERCVQFILWVKGLVHLELNVIIYPPSCHSKPVWLCFS